MRLQPDDIEDIKRMLPTMGRPAVAAYIGCDPATVLYHARKLNIPRATLPAGRPSRRRFDHEAGLLECTSCSTMKPVEDFNLLRRSPVGRAWECKCCLAERRKYRR